MKSRNQEFISFGKIINLYLLSFLSYSKIILNTLKYAFYSDYSDEQFHLGLLCISYQQLQLYYVFVSDSRTPMGVFTPLPKIS